MQTLLMPVLNTQYNYYIAVKPSRKRALAKAYIRYHRVKEINQILNGCFSYLDDRDIGIYVKDWN